jgi:hypothetical protein
MRKPLVPPAAPKKAKTKKPRTSATLRGGNPTAAVLAKVKASTAHTIVEGVTGSTRDLIKYRLLAEYLKRPERSFVWVFQNVMDTDGKPLFPKYIKLVTAQAWHTNEGWAQKREEMIASVEIGIIEQLRDSLLRQTIQEMNNLWDVREHMFEYVRPKRDRNGNVKRHGPEAGDLEGLPVFPLDVTKGGMHKFIEAFLKLDERIADRRNESVRRIEAAVSEANGGEESIDVEGSSTETPQAALAKRMNLGEEQLRQMAHSLLRQSAEAVSQDDTEDEPTTDEESGDDEGI